MQYLVIWNSYFLEKIQKIQKLDTKDTIEKYVPMAQKNIGQIILVKNIYFGRQI